MRRFIILNLFTASTQYHSFFELQDDLLVGVPVRLHHVISEVEEDEEGVGKEEEETGVDFVVRHHRHHQRRRQCRQRKSDPVHRVWNQRLSGWDYFRGVGPHCRKQHPPVNDHEYQYRHQNAYL